MPATKTTNTTSGLANAGIERTISKTAPSQAAKQESTDTQLAELDASALIIERNPDPRPVPSPATVSASTHTICTDHMLQATWTFQAGWSRPTLRAYGPLAIYPTASVLHYATECFEGLKLYRGYDGRLRLFRPQLNCSRMLASSVRISLPAFPPSELLALLSALCRLDAPKWLPRDRPGEFLYFRPIMFGSHPAIGVQPPQEATLTAFLAMFPQGRIDPAAGEDPTKEPGMKLLASRHDELRAWPGGFGHAKIGANYGPSLLATGEARRQGFTQVLWLFGDAEVTEAGASNFFVVWRTAEGVLELVTAPLDDRVILDGITRRSVLQLARERLCEGVDTTTNGASGVSMNELNGGEVTLGEPLRVVERKFTMNEIARVAHEGRLAEAFVAGTAHFITAVSLIRFRDEDIRVPVPEGAEMGRYGTLFKTWLEDIMYGKVEHEWGYVVDEEA